MARDPSERDKTTKKTQPGRPQGAGWLIRIAVPIRCRIDMARDLSQGVEQGQGEEPQDETAGIGSPGAPWAAWNPW